MNANEMTFGIEIECTLPEACGVQPSGYGVSRSVQFPGLPMGWKASTDCSINAGPGRIGCEVISPVLRGAAGLEEAQNAVRTLNVLGATVNPSCGFHVHIGFDRANVEGLKRLIASVALFEAGLFAITGTDSRERSNYCRPIGRAFASINLKARTGYELGADTANRYHSLNVANITTGSHGHNTVEFRLFAGSTNAAKIVGYVRVCLAIVERALGLARVGSFVNKAPAGTTGHGHATRMFYRLGWIGGRSETVYGNVTSDALPTLKASKKLLLGLAKKYDAKKAPAAAAAV